MFAPLFSCGFDEITQGPVFSPDGLLPSYILSAGRDVNMPIPPDRDAAKACYHEADPRQLHERGSECRCRVHAKRLISDQHTTPFCG